MTNSPSAEQLMQVVDGTWPAAAMVEAGPWILREGRGGGKRVSATTLRGDLADSWTDDDLQAAEKAMALMDQPALFMIRPGLGAAEQALDQALDARGYQVVDPVNIYVIPAQALCDLPIPRVTAFNIWEPLAIMREIWEKGGIGAARQRVMDRAKGPKTGIFGRITDKPAGSAFCAMDQGIAMVHAVEVTEPCRRKGLAAWMMRSAAFWARDNGADWLSVICTTENDAANGLYRALGMDLAGQYHYRLKPLAESDAS
ncbi:MAG: GNAT family N-acetyltransferase [Pelagimonas sp.]|jgi:GNAT superfamily N-acetyltransferase|nr:GNAT family N-acetyltransferase [Pelagimonas sp.]